MDKPFITESGWSIDSTLEGSTFLISATNKHNDKSCYINSLLEDKIREHLARQGVTLTNTEWDRYFSQLSEASLRV